MITEQTVLLVYPSLAFAYRFKPINLSVGFTGQVAAMLVDYSMVVDGDAGSTPPAGGRVNYVSPDFGYVFQSAEGVDYATPNRLQTFGWQLCGIAGLLWEPTRNWSLGASVRPGFTVDTKGTIEVDFPVYLKDRFGLEVVDNDATLQTRMPTVARAGVEYKSIDEGARWSNWAVEANYVWEGWSVMDAFRVGLDGRVVSQASGIGLNQKLPDLKLLRNYEDAWSARLGGEYQAWKAGDGNSEVRVRLGSFYEKGASPNEWTNLDFVSFDRYAGSVGVSYQATWGSIDAAYSYMYSPKREVTNGKFEAIVPLWVCEDPPTDELTVFNGAEMSYAEACAQQAEQYPDATPSHAVNNGTYDVAHQLFSIGTTIRL
jgi:long-subunit fatty acid transport protein